jgi:hypothetical protein
VCGTYLKHCVWCALLFMTKKRKSENRRFRGTADAAKAWSILTDVQRAAFQLAADEDHASKKTATKRRFVGWPKPDEKGIRRKHNTTTTSSSNRSSDAATVSSGPHEGSGLNMEQYAAAAPFLRRVSDKRG